MTRKIFPKISRRTVLKSTAGAIGAGILSSQEVAARSNEGRNSYPESKSSERSSTVSNSTLNDYERAELFLDSDGLVLNDEITPNWIGETDQFWYQRETPNGKMFMKVKVSEEDVSPAFDHKKLARALEKVSGNTVEPHELPFDEYEYTENKRAITFNAFDKRYKCGLENYDCNEEPVESEQKAGKSPDGEWIAYTKNYDLFVKSTKSDEELRLTNDGTKRNAYATPTVSPLDIIEAAPEDGNPSDPAIQMGPEDVDQPADVQWSPDSTKIVTYRLDKRKASQLTLVQSSPPENPVRPRSFNYTYPLAGEEDIPVAEGIVFDIEQQSKSFLDIEPIPVRSIQGEPQFSWYDDSERLHYIYRPRGYESAQFIEFDASTGKSQTIIEEKSDTIVDPHMSGAEVVNENEMIWRSERSGWHHMYHVDTQNGNVTTQITSGEWVVRNILQVDNDSRTIYFTAGGREPDRDPYLRHFYRVNFDGSDLTLLTPEPLDHTINISPSGEYFVDTYSTVNTAPVTVLRDTSDGSVVFKIEEANTDHLLATGWKKPEPFKVKAADDKTDIYGLIWYPSDFDSSNNYPVIEQIYTGPHDFHVPKTFDAYQKGAQSLAELGFIVVMIDGRGTGRRSKSFRDMSYKNLARIGVPDHKVGIQRIAKGRSYMDISRVGIHGTSAGGYDSTHQILRHSDFYDVAVSIAGNHDFRMDKAWWNELWMGYPLNAHYEMQSNITWTDQLEGDLLLGHGKLDNNVPPSATFALADALSKDNKDFDMYIASDEHHGIGTNYFTRIQWDYFVQKLKNETPPPNYEIDDQVEAPAFWHA